MITSYKYKRANLSVKYFDEKKYLIGRIDEYLYAVKQELSNTANGTDSSMDELVKVLMKAGRQNNDVMILGYGNDIHLISHANTDFLKMNHLKTACMGIPEITAFGNDYPHPHNFTEWLSKRSFGNGSVLIGIQLGKPSPLLAEAFSYNHRNNGINVLISNLIGCCDSIDVFVPVLSKDELIACDILQLIFHYASVNIAYKTNRDFHDKGAGSLKDYCCLLQESLENPAYSNEILADISMLLKGKIKTGRTLFLFGNGGSASIAAYFADGMKRAYNGSKEIRNIIDVTSHNSGIMSSLHMGSYKSVFTQIIKNLGVEEGDILLGVSSSGSSKNIIHPFTEIRGTTRIGILGFEDGGIIGQNDMAELAFIVPDSGSFRSYQRAEDGQRIALSSILSTF